MKTTQTAPLAATVQPEVLRIPDFLTKEECVILKFRSDTHLQNWIEVTVNARVQLQLVEAKKNVAANFRRRLHELLEINTEVTKL